MALPEAEGRIAYPNFFEFLGRRDRRMSEKDNETKSQRSLRHHSIPLPFPYRGSAGDGHGEIKLFRRGNIRRCSVYFASLPPRFGNEYEAGCRASGDDGPCSPTPAVPVRSPDWSRCTGSSRRGNPPV